MEKFLGVISSYYQHPSHDLVLEFTDLDLLANFLLDETQNLHFEFQRKCECTTEREIILSQNLIKITEIDNLYQLLRTKTLELERESDKIECLLCNIEKYINSLESLPTNFAACKCTSNPERSLILEGLVDLSSHCWMIEKQVGQVKEEDSYIPNDNPCDLTRNLLTFLDLHTIILQNIEQQINRVTDQLQEVDRLFINAYKIRIGACYHSSKYDNASNC